MLHAFVCASSTLLLVLRPGNMSFLLTILAFFSSPPTSRDFAGFTRSPFRRSNQTTSNRMFGHEGASMCTTQDSPSYHMMAGCESDGGFFAFVCFTGVGVLRGASETSSSRWPDVCVLLGSVAVGCTTSRRWRAFLHVPSKAFGATAFKLQSTAKKSVTASTMHSLPASYP